MAKDPEKGNRFLNQHQINQISRLYNSPFLDCWEGTVCAA
jgi:hypothetical protein